MDRSPWLGIELTGMLMIGMALRELLEEDRGDCLCGREGRTRLCQAEAGGAQHVHKECGPMIAEILW